MSSQGPNNYGTLANDASNSGEYSWTIPGSTYAAESIVSTYGGTHYSTQLLKATNFGFSIPSGAVIDGILVEWKEGQGATSGVVDHDIKIVKGGTIGSTNKASTGNWSAGGQTWTSYGGSTDLWGLSWTYSDINASNFGAVLTAYNTNGYKDAEGVNVDGCRITVYYHNPTPTVKTIKPGGGGDYTNLADWWAWAKTQSLGYGQWAECYGGGDLGPCVMDTSPGWTTDSTHYVKIYAAAGQQHSGTWDSSKARISVSSYATNGNDAYSAACIYAALDYTCIDGLQMTDSDTTYGNNSIRMQGNYCKFQNNLIVLSQYTIAGIGTGYGLGHNGYVYGNIIRNNFIYGVGTSYGVGIDYSAGDSHDDLYGTIQNNTVANMSIGIMGLGNGAFSGGAAGQWYIQNNIALTCSTSNCFYNGGATYSGSPIVGNNLSSDSTDFGGSNNLHSQTASNVVNSVSSDLRLKVGSSAIDAGADLSGSFTTDIRGVTRPQGSAFDIGAYELIPVPTVKTVKPGGGGDYTTLQAWWDGVRGSALGVGQYAECYGGGDLGPLDWSSGAGQTTSSTNYYKIYAAAGNQHNGSFDSSKAKITTYTSGYCMHNAMPNYTRIVGLQFDLGTSHIGIDAQSAATCTIDSCFFNIGNGSQGIYNAHISHHPTIQNCFFLGNGNNSNYGTYFSCTDYEQGAVRLYNNTASNLAVGFGVSDDYADNNDTSVIWHVENNMAISCGTGFACINFGTNGSAGGGPGSIWKNNISNDSSATALPSSWWTGGNVANNYTGVTGSTEVVSTSSDLKLLSGASAVDTGIDLSSLFTYDGVGNARPQASGWDIGANEYTAPSGATYSDLAASASGSMSIYVNLRRYKEEPIAVSFVSLASGAFTMGTTLAINSVANFASTAKLRRKSRLPFTDSFQSQLAVDIDGGTGAIVTSDLTSGSSNNASSYNTANFTPPSDELNLVFVTNTLTNATATIPTASGCGMIWTQVATIEFTRNGGNVHQRLTCFRGMQHSGITTGHLTFDFSGTTQTGCAWSIFSVANVVLTGTNGSNAVVQAVTNSVNTGSATTLTVTLAAFGSIANGSVAGFATNTNANITPGGGWTKVANAGYNSPTTTIETQYDTLNDTTVNATFNAGDALGIAIECKTAPTYQNLGSATGFKGNLSAAAILRRKARLPASASLASTVAAAIRNYMTLGSTPNASITSTATLRRKSRLPVAKTFASQWSAVLVGNSLFASATTASLLSFATLRRERRQQGLATTLESTIAASGVIANSMMFASPSGSLASSVILRRLREMPASGTLEAIAIATMAQTLLFAAAVTGNMITAAILRRKSRPATTSASFVTNITNDFTMASFFGATPHASLSAVAKLRRLRREPVTDYFSTQILAALLAFRPSGDTWYLEQSILHQTFNIGSYTPTAVYVGLVSDIPSIYDTGSTITEPTDSNYRRILVPSDWWTVSLAGTIDLNTDVPFPTAGSPWSNLKYMVLCDAPLGGRLLKWTPLSVTVNVASGQSFVLTPAAATSFHYNTGDPISTSWRRVINTVIAKTIQPKLTSNLSLALMTGPPTTVANGMTLLEPDPATGYHRVQLSLGPSWWRVDDTNTLATNKTDISFGTPETDWGTITHYALVTNPVGGEMILWNALPSGINAIANTEVVLPSGYAQFRVQAP